VSIRQREEDGHSNIIEVDNMEEIVIIEENHVVEDETYPGGSINRSLLANYEDHVAKQLWNGFVSNNVDIHALKLMFYLL